MGPFVPPVRRLDVPVDVVVSALRRFASLSPRRLVSSARNDLLQIASRALTREISLAPRELVVIREWSQAAVIAATAESMIAEAQRRVQNFEQARSLLAQAQQLTSMLRAFIDRVISTGGQDIAANKQMLAVDATTIANMLGSVLSILPVTIMDALNP